VLFKSIEQSVKNMHWIDKLAQDNLETYHQASLKKTDEQQPGSATATAQILAETLIDVESAIKPLPIPVVSALVEMVPVRTDDLTIAVKKVLEQHNPSSTVGAPVSDDDQEQKDNDSDTSDDWDAVKVPVSPVSKGTDYSLSNAMQYIGRVTTPYLSWLYGKQNTH
jgi:hypothetical protein